MQTTDREGDNNMNHIDFSAVEITGGFWKKKQELARKSTLWAVRDRFEET